MKSTTSSPPLACVPKARPWTCLLTGAPICCAWAAHRRLADPSQNTACTRGWVVYTKMICHTLLPRHFPPVRCTHLCQRKTALGASALAVVGGVVAAPSRLLLAINRASLLNPRPLALRRMADNGLRARRVLGHAAPIVQRHPEARRVPKAVRLCILE